MNPLASLKLCIASAICFRLLLLRLLSALPCSCNASPATAAGSILAWADTVTIVPSTWTVAAFSASRSWWSNGCSFLADSGSASSSPPAAAAIRAARTAPSSPTFRRRRSRPCRRRPRALPSVSPRPGRGSARYRACNSGLNGRASGGMSLSSSRASASASGWCGLSGSAGGSSQGGGSFFSTGEAGGRGTAEFAGSETAAWLRTSTPRRSQRRNIRGLRAAVT